MKIDITSNITLDEAKARLSSKMNSDYDSDFLPIHAVKSSLKYYEGVYGKIKEDKFIGVTFEAYNLKGQNPFGLRCLRGKLEELDGKCRLSGKFKFTTVFNVSLVSALLLIILILFKLNSSPLSKLIIALFYCVFVFLGATICKATNKKLEKSLVDMITELLSEETETQADT